MPDVITINKVHVVYRKKYEENTEIWKTGRAIRVLSEGPTITSTQSDKGAINMFLKNNENESEDPIADFLVQVNRALDYSHVKSKFDRDAIIQDVRCRIYSIRKNLSSPEHLRNIVNLAVSQSIKNHFRSQKRHRCESLSERHEGRRGVGDFRSVRQNHRESFPTRGIAEEAPRDVFARFREIRELSEDFYALVNRLGPEQSQLLTLLLSDRFQTDSEIARVIGVSNGELSKRRKVMLSQLRAILFN